VRDEAVTHQDGKATPRDLRRHVGNWLLTVKGEEAANMLANDPRMRTDKLDDRPIARGDKPSHHARQYVSSRSATRTIWGSSEVGGTTR